MRYIYQSLLVFMLFPIFCQAQMWNGQDTLYGNEWINFEQEYYKLEVAEDGIYRISFEALDAIGIPLNNITADQFQLFSLGEEVPLYISTTGNLSNGDYIEFYGQQNRSELDQFLFKNPVQDMLNPQYSLFNDNRAYFLTWTEVTTNALRYETIENDLTNLPPKESFYWHDLIHSITDRFVKRENTADIKQSYFDKAEGYAGTFRNTQTISIAPDAIYPTNDSATIRIRLAGNATSHDLLISLNGQPRVNDLYFGFEVREYEFRELLAEDDNELIFDFLGQQASNDRANISNIILTYPRRFDLLDTSFFQFNLTQSSLRRYIELENFTGSNAIAYDVQNAQRLVPDLASGNLARLALPGDISPRQLVLANDAGIRTVSAINKIDFVDYLEADADFIFITHTTLRNPSNGADQVQEYANYRASQQGGGYDPIIVDVQQIYEQFAYGIDRHNIAIRNFGHYIKKHWTDPKYVFLVGKAVEYPNLRTAEGITLNDGINFFVPTFGSPGGDNLILSDNFNSEPIISLGRISATTPKEVEIYLNKVKEFEMNKGLPQTLADRAWMKRVIHLGGGDVSIQNTIKNHLTVIENVLEDNQFGAEVASFYKTSSEPIQISTSGQILDLINNGVSIITFFGHSGSNNFDFSLDSPETYENQGKYPVMFSLGCYSGQIHGETKGISERFIFEENKGALGFFASTSLSYISGLRIISEEYYRQLGTALYGRGLGDVLKEVIRIHENNNSIGVSELTQQFTLHGDPSVVLNAHPGPDYLVDSESVQFDPPKINIELDSFEISFDVINIGSNKTDSLQVEVMQTFPEGGELLIVRDKIQAPANTKTLSYTIPIYNETGVGLNKFFIKVDADDDITELPAPDAELNNSLVNQQGETGISVYFTSNVAQPVFPTEFAIVNDENLFLKASTSNSFAERKNYIIQIDTTEEFNSNFLKEKQVEQIGGIIKWEPTVNWEEETVYYWRISPDSTDLAGYNWRSSSFVFLENSEQGWNQSHYYQQAKDRYTNMELPEETRKMKYLDDIKDIRITQGVYPNIRPDISINNVPNSYFPWDGPIRGGFIAAVLDSVTIDPWLNDPADGGDYGSNVPSWANGYAGFPYSTRNQNDRASFMNFLEEVIPDGNYVVLISVQETNHDYQPQDWAIDSVSNGGRNIFNVLESQGATLIRQAETTGALPYYLIYKKGDPSFEAQEGFGDLESIITRSFGLVGSWNSGSIITDKIGPSKSWKTLEWNLSGLEQDDIVSIDVIGVRNDSIEVPILEGITTFTSSLDEIDENIYPYIRLQFNSMDTITQTTPHLDYWRVLYTGLPEMALNPAAHFEFYKDTLQQGDQLRMEIGMENIGGYDMDSLLLHFSVVDQNNVTETIAQKIKPLLKGDSIIAEFTLETKALQGDYNLIVEANPNEDQPEQFHFNNVGLNSFFVDSDKRNPLLDVTFDGVHIMDGDLVSAKPFIQINLEDENEFLALADTNLFKLFLQYPDETELRPISFNSDRVQFYPASENELSQGNKASIEIRPEFELDGTYELIVQAEDVTGNQSGRIDYKIAFQIINESMISNVFNYPNPFSTSTQFVYTLTGDQAPEFFKIQIMTVSGRIVKEITQEELGPLKPGTHRTEYTWDGTDDYGDRLANGVYLYRIVAKDVAGADIKKYETGTDQFFTNNIGKLVILR